MGLGAPMGMGVGMGGGMIGGGMIAFATAWALRELFPKVPVVLATTESSQRELATSLGVREVIAPPGPDVVTRAGHYLRTKRLAPTVGGAFLATGFRSVYECVGSAASMSTLMPTKIARSCEPECGLASGKRASSLRSDAEMSLSVARRPKSVRMLLPRLPDDGLNAP
jgi:hypothetical protein